MTTCALSTIRRCGHEVPMLALLILAVAIDASAQSVAVRISTMEPSKDAADLQPLRGVIGSARLVAFGESGHGVHEFLAFRNRLFQFFVEQMGFTAIALETGYSEALALDQYVAGGAGDATALAQAAFCHDPNGLEENRQLLDWTRRHNAAAGNGRKIRLYGVDLSCGREGDSPDARVAVEQAVAYLHEVDPGSAEDFRRRLKPLIGRFSPTAFGSLPGDQQDAMTGTIEDLVSVLERREVDFVATSASLRRQSALRNANNARQMTAYLRAARVDAAKRPRDLRESMMVRDRAMADNLAWVLKQEGPEGRVLAFAHNYHVKKAPAGKHAYPEWFPGNAPTSMGEYLRLTLGTDLFVLGTCFGRAAEDLKMPPLAEGSVDEALASVGIQAFVVDLRSPPTEGGPVGVSDQERQMRFNDRYFTVNPHKAFDALMFIDHVTAAHSLR